MSSLLFGEPSGQVTMLLTLQEAGKQGSGGACMGGEIINTSVTEEGEKSQ